MTKAEKQAYDRERYRKNREKRLAQARAYHATHAAEQAEKARERYANRTPAEKDARRIASNAWQRAHPETRAAWLAKNRSKQALYDRKTRWRAEYGLEMEDVETMLEAQGGKCGICARPVTLSASIDHSHDYSAKDRAGHRGLLCNPCNIRIGYADTYGLPLSQQEASYLARWRKRVGLPEDLTLRRTIGE